MALSSLRQLFHSCEDDWIKLEQVRDFLNSGTSGEVNLKRLTSYDIQRQSHIETKKVGESLYIKDVSVLRFIFTHSHNIALCNQLAKQITGSVLCGDAAWNAGRVELYNSLLQSTLFTGVNGYVLNLFKDATIPQDYLGRDVLAYKGHFDEIDWQKICIFEHNVAVCNQDFKEKNPAVQDQIRWDFYEKCLNARKLGEDLRVNIDATLQHRKLRKQSTEVSEGIQLYCDVPHLPMKIDSDIHDAVETDLGLQLKVVCVDLNTSTDNNDIVVFLETALSQYWQEIGTCIANITEQKHNLQCKLIVQLQKGTLLKYSKTGTDVARFGLYDDFLRGSLDSMVIHQWEPNVESSNLDQVNCETCFPPSLPTPLSLSNFDLIKEWILDVPMPVQCLLLSFINKTTLSKNTNKEKFLRKKLQRFYLTFDTLLNTLNKNHEGVLQTANTDELLMHHKSVTTVFAITGAAGITKCLRQAEKLLLPFATDDFMYYNTFIKGTPLTYETDAGVISKSVSLQNTENVIIIDNLHRLLSRSDPQPGKPIKLSI